VTLRIKSRVSLARQWRARWTIWKNVKEVGIRNGEVILSFDDGPYPEVTQRLLDVLQRENVRAAFCVCGKSIRAAPGLVRRMMDEHHLIVNHGDLHQPLALFSSVALEEEVLNCDQTIAVALEMPGFSADFYRPACGLWTPTVAKVLAKLRKRVFPITHFGWDTNISRGNYREWIANTRSAACDDQGGIFVLHDRRLRFWAELKYDPNDVESSAYRGWVPDAVTLLIQQLRSDGFTFLDPQIWAERSDGKIE
jgi:peptidoglycan/xylan/chitin deacetylase (PgdA/CDA1 family)